MLRLFSAVLLLVLFSTVTANSSKPPALAEIVDNWSVRIRTPSTNGEKTRPVVFTIPSLPEIVVTDEPHSGLAVYQPKAAPFVRGSRLRGILAAELTSPNLIDPASIEVKSSFLSNAQTFQRGVDYEIEPVYGCIGRLTGGAIAENQPVVISYRHTLQRLDSIVTAVNGAMEYRVGLPASSAPHPPELSTGETRLLNIFLPGRISKIRDEHLFPVLEMTYPVANSLPETASADTTLPRTLEKLRSGKPLRILAWGDSVTAGEYLEARDRDGWQQQFVSRLKQQFPEANIELITEGWGGQTTQRYLQAPAGHEHNYQEKVLGAKPDLVISEFVNDARLDPEGVETRYGQILNDFRGINAEWIILTPHYVRPDWMGLKGEQNIDDDPRPYVKGLRMFAERHQIAIADASLRYGRLWRQGIPYTTLMMNGINHPDARGMSLFADSLMELFREGR